VTTLGWFVLGGAALFAIALLRALVTTANRFPMDPEIYRPSPTPVDEVEEQWLEQAALERRTAQARRSRRAWKLYAKDVLAPLVDTSQRTAPRRYNHAWVDATLRSVERDLGLEKDSP